MSDEIVFASVKAAVLWAEETLHRSHVKNTIGQLLSKPGSGTLTRQDLVDIAHTISNLTTNCKPYRGACMKAVYGIRDHDLERQLGIAIAKDLRSMPAAKGKKTERLIALGEATVRSVRYRELLGKRYGVNRIAKDVGISRERFYKAESWRELRRASKLRVYDWLDMVETELWLELDVRGWIA